jgi:two-component system, chemotaxis family, chemotaxis protein CheY
MRLRFEDITVLLADDSASMRQLLKASLESFGIKQVILAENGDRAFELICKGWADLAIIDWNMSPTNGVELLRLLRNSPQSPNPYIPVMMLTGHADMDRVSEARDAGMTEFLTKPIAPKMLYERIEAVFSNPRTFIRSNDYFGPDRRRRDGKYRGDDRRTKPGDLDGDKG